MECKCPHCGHLNTAEPGQLRRCDSCKKAYEHGDKKMPVLPPAPKPATEKQCPFCAETIKASAIKCKHCGEMLGERPATVESESHEAQESSKAKPSLFGILVLLFVVFWIVGKCNNTDSTTHSASDPVASLFSAWDGSNKEMVRETKSRMNNPDSFEHVETRYSDRGDKVLLKMTFRGKNAFNATITKTATALIDPQTRTISNFYIGE